MTNENQTELRQLLISQQPQLTLVVPVDSLPLKIFQCLGRVSITFINNTYITPNTHNTHIYVYIYCSSFVFRHTYTHTNTKYNFLPPTAILGRDFLREDNNNNNKNPILLTRTKHDKINTNKQSYMMISFEDYTSLVQH